MVKKKTKKLKRKAKAKKNPELLLRILYVSLVLVGLTSLVLLLSGCTITAMNRDLVGLRYSDLPRDLNYSDPQRPDYKTSAKPRDWDLYVQQPYFGGCQVIGPHYHGDVYYGAGYWDGRFYHWRY